MCFDFLYIFVWNISHSRTKWARYDTKYVFVFMSSTLYSYPILITLGFFRQIFKNLQMSNFMKIRPVGARLFHAYRRTDRHDEANSRFSRFCGKRLKVNVFLRFHGNNGTAIALQRRLVDWHRGYGTATHMQLGLELAGPLCAAI
jgi:hypothetical protein